MFPTEVILADDRLAVTAARERVLTTGGLSSLSYRIQHGKTGQVRHLQCTFESTVEDGVVMTATATHVDVTETVVAMEIADMLKSEAAADQRAMLLRRISDALAAAYLGPEGPLHSIADLAAADLNAAAVLRVLTPDLLAVELDVTSHPDERIRSTIADAMTRSTQCFEPGPVRDEVIRKGRIVSSDQTTRPANHDRFVEQTGWRFEHSITAPMRHNGRVLGLFCVLRLDPASHFEIGDEHLVQVLADRAGSAIAEHRVRTDLEREGAQRLQELTEQQRELLEELAGMELRERSHMAESIHDEPIQLIVAAAMRIDTLRMGRSGSDGEELDRLAALLESSVDWLRNLIQVDLAPPDLTYGIGGALQNLADGLFDRSRPLQIVGPMNVNLSPPTTAAAYRILREALINTHKHAHARNVAVRIAPLDSMVVFSVTDDGVGTADTTGPGHLGLATMRARAEAEGGQLHIHSAPGAGMTTVLTLPITAPSS
jgi:signal transduction histidine kinase